MKLTIDVRELAERFREVMAVANAGGEVVVMDGRISKARLISCEGQGPRIPDLHPGAMQMAPDFDAEMPEGFWEGRG